MKKKIVALSISGAMLAIALVGGTLAYFTDEDAETNVFTVGNVDINLTEPNWGTTGEKEAVDAYPGEALAKDPTVKNIGKNPCFVRVSVTGLDQYETMPIIYRTDYVDYKLGTNWEYNETDKYFYYTKVLDLDATTDALFDQIVIPTGLENDTAAQPIVVKAEAVQAQGAKASFADVEKMTVAEIAAWFTTCMQ